MDNGGRANHEFINTVRQAMVLAERAEYLTFRHSRSEIGSTVTAKRWM